MTPEQQELKRRACRKVDLQMLPDELAERLEDVAWWKRRLAEVKAEGYPHRIKQVQEILDLMELDAKQINRRIQAWLIG